MPNTEYYFDHEQRCRICGNAPTFRRTEETVQRESGICRSCLDNLIHCAKSEMAEWTGVENAELSFLSEYDGWEQDDSNVWPMFDALQRSKHLLHSIRSQAASDQPHIHWSWSEGDGVAAPSQLINEVELIRKLMAQYGYREVEVIIAMPESLREPLKRGDFWRRSGSDRAQRTATISFQKPTRRTPI